MTYNSLAELFTAIANSIRGKTGGTEKIVANDFPAAIDGISSGGGDEWYITDARYLFYQGYRLDVLNELIAKCKGTTTANNMFGYVSTNVSLDLRNLDTSKMTSMDNMFYRSSGITSVDVSNWDTSEVTSMAGMFLYCTSLASIDVSNWDTSKLSNAENMFQGCTALTSIDLSNWDTSGMRIASRMFNECAGLAEIIGFSTTGVMNVNSSFPEGRSSSPYALKRLTFRTDLPDGVYSIRSPIKIPYCSFERSGMVEMFNTLPDVSSLDLYSGYTTITITGNPCVTDGSLTAEDEAIATAKGWTLVK